MSRVTPTPVSAGTDSLYDVDFHAWTRRTAQLLRARQLDQVDLEHVAEEIEDMGKRDAKELQSRMQILIAHLLKWQLQPSKRSRSWQRTIVTQRLRIALLLGQSPSLRPKLPVELAKSYPGAVQLASVDTGLPKRAFPAQCPYRPKQVLDEDFLPG